MDRKVIVISRLQTSLSVILLTYRAIFDQFSGPLVGLPCNFSIPPDALGLALTFIIWELILCPVKLIGPRAIGSNITFDCLTRL